MGANQQPKVLIVDDRPENLLAMGHVLSGLDAELINAGSGNEALALTLRHDIALILLDVQMPEMDGYEVATLLRKREATSEIPIIFVTAIDNEEQHVIQGYDSGAVDYLFKPVNPNILKSKVRVFLELFSSKKALIEKSNEMQSFAYLAAHDLKAPLRAVASFSQFLLEDIKDERYEETDTCMAHLVDAVNRMFQLIDDLLEYARMGRSDLPRSRISINSVVEDALSLLAVPRLEAKAEISIPELPVITGNEAALVQLMQNLFGNAIKFRSEESPVIDMGCRWESGVWRFTIADNGIGIDPEHYGTIFAPLKRLHSQSEFEGSGLGLANCRKIVENHGGRIWVEQNPTGRGTIFCFTLAGIESESVDRPGTQKSDGHDSDGGNLRDEVAQTESSLDTNS